MRTLTEYLKDNAKNGIIDFAFRASTSTVADEEIIHLIIHPDGKDGDTIDFEVNENILTTIADSSKQE